MPEKIVHVAAENPLFRESLRATIASFGIGDVVSASSEGDEGTMAVREIQPDILVVSTSPQEHTAEHLQWYRQAAPQAHIVGFAFNEDEAKDLVALGIETVVSVKSARAEVMRVLRQVDRETSAAASPSCERDNAYVHPGDKAMVGRRRTGGSQSLHWPFSVPASVSRSKKVCMMSQHGGFPAIRVLVLDDEQLILMDIADTLEDAGFEPICVRSGATALQAIKATRPDVAILDVSLENETCEAVAKRLRALKIPFMLHTGNPERQSELVARLDAPILAKPALPSTIVQVVQNLYRISLSEQFS